MRLIRVDAESPDPDALREAAEVLTMGGLVVIPTETVYGLGANALDPDAVGRIFAAKQRPSFNPLIVHCPDVSNARSFAASWPEAASRLAEAFWPGPLTMVLPKSDVPDIVTAGLDTVALRVPDHPVARALLGLLPFPVAAPSANRYTTLSPTDAHHVADGELENVDLLLDAGPAKRGIESTVVDLSGSVPVLLRPGSITRRELEQVLGERVSDPRDFATSESKPSPGMARKHYSPQADLWVVPRTELAPLSEKLSARGRRVALITLGEIPSLGRPSFALGDTAAQYAAGLYSLLHRCDAEGYEDIIIESPPADEEWEGVRDRLKRAAYKDSETV